MNCDLRHSAQIIMKNIFNFQRVIPANRAPDTILVATLMCFWTASASAEISNSLATQNGNQANLQRLVSALSDARNSDGGELAAVYDRLNAPDADLRQVVNALRTLLPEVTRQKHKIERSLHPHHAVGRAARPSIAANKILLQNATRSGIGPMYGSVFPLNAMPSTTSNQNPEPSFSLWMQVWGDNGSQKDTDNLNGFDAQARGVSLGLDHGFTSAWTVSVALGTLCSDIDSDEFGKDEEDGIEFTTGVYYASVNHNISINAGYVRSQTDRRRVIIVNPGAGPRRLALDSDLDSSQIILGTNYAYGYTPTPNLLISPYISLSWSKVDTDDYNEVGAGSLSLDVSTDDQAQLVGSLGLDAMWLIDRGLWTWSPSIGLAFTEVFKSERLETFSRFRGHNRGFRTQGLSDEKSIWSYQAGLSATHTSGFSASLTYSGHNQSDYLYDALALTLQTQF